MHIAYSSDNNYAQHLAVTMASLLKNVDADSFVHFHILTPDLSIENREKILALKSIRDCEIEFISISDDLFKDWPCWGHLKLATYYRLYLPELLPDVDKVIYIDVDTIVHGDIKNLWDIPLKQDEWIGACIEHFVPSKFPQTLSLTSDDYYINAGVMLMNLKSLRENDFVERCIEFVKENYTLLKYLDQDILNVVCKDNIKVIPPQYNMNFNNVYRLNRLRYRQDYHSQDVLQKAFYHPVVIHFCGSIKPWYYACRYEWAHTYMDYIKFTPWSSYQYPDKNIKKIISKGVYLGKIHSKGLIRKLFTR